MPKTSWKLRRSSGANMLLRHIEFMESHSLVDTKLHLRCRIHSSADSDSSSVLVALMHHSYSSTTMRFRDTSSKINQTLLDDRLRRCGLVGRSGSECRRGLTRILCLRSLLLVRRVVLLLRLLSRCLVEVALRRVHLVLRLGIRLILVIRHARIRSGSGCL